MHSIHDYPIVIFDCDGVIFDSNNLKVKAMTDVLSNEDDFDNKYVEAAIDYFKNNFGISRVRHVDYFIDRFVNEARVDKDTLKGSILENYSLKCVELYGKADFTPGFLEFIEGFDSIKYVASGSDELELKEVLKKRGAIHYFSGVFGSPNKKSDVVAEIVSQYGVKNTVMVGDSISDFEAARASNIDFIYYSPYSNVKDAMSDLKIEHGFMEMEKF